jgi:tetratricopeptide (TPR) repeat protein
VSEVLVIMPYGCRSYLSYETTVKSDFDQIYADLIRPAIDAAGHQPLRVDEMVVGGDITHQYIEKIFASEIVIADLSMPNGNVYYELGIRQSLSNQPTILIARHGTDLPIDVRNQRILFYHFGDSEQDNSFSAKLSSQLQNIRPSDYRNPIQAYLKIAGLSSDPSNGEAFEKDLRGKIERASNAEQLVAVWNWVRGFNQLPPYPLLDLAEKCSAYKLWYLAAQITKVACRAKPQDYEIHRRLGWYLRNAGADHYDEAEAAFRKGLELNPGDPEAIGMLGGLLKRKRQYGAAAEIYSRGVVIAPDNLYLRVAHAGTKLLSSAANPNDAITLYSAIKSQYSTIGVVPDEWIHSVLGEAEFVLGNMEGARHHFKKVREMASSATSLTSPADQIELFGRAGFLSKESIEVAQYVRQLANSFGPSSEIQVELPDKEKRAAARKPPVILHLSDVHFRIRN